MTLVRVPRCNIMPPAFVSVGSMATEANVAGVGSGPKWPKSGLRGGTVKRHSLAHAQAKPVRPNAVSPANTDKVKPSAPSRSLIRATVNGGAAVIGKVFTAILIRR